LKFYVVRSVPKNGGGFGPDEMVDTIVTGRISVNLDTQRRQLNPNPFALDPDLDSGPTKPTEAPASPLSSAPAAPRPRDRVGLVPTNKRTAQAQVPAAAPGEDKSTLRYEGRTFGEWRQDWLNHGPREFEALTALQAFAAAGYGQEATDLVASGVYSESAAIAQRSRRFLSMLPKPEAERVVARLISVLESELSSRRRIDLIRAIAAIGPNANSAMEVLKQSMANKEPQERIAAAAAIKMIVGKDQYQKPVADVLGKELGITVVETDSRWAALPREDVKDGGKAFADFTKAVIEEQQQLFPGGKF